MNILAIGNSFSEDATRYLHEVAKADGEELTVVNLYIGGCSLDRHYRNMMSGEKAYELHFNGKKTGFFVSLDEALLNREWDVVTLQQASHKSFDSKSYNPYIGELASHVRKCSPKARIYVHQTWAYEAGSDRLLNVAGYETPEQMLSDVIRSYDAAAKEIDADGIIRSGELFARLLDNGIERVHRDTFHASLPLGRYALALLWYVTLFGKGISDVEICKLEECISVEEERIVKQCAELFLEKELPYESI